MTVMWSPDTPSVFDAGLPGLAYLDAQVPGEAHSKIRASRQQAPIALGPFGPEVLSYELVCAALSDDRFQPVAPPGVRAGHDRFATFLGAVLTPRVAERLGLSVLGMITELLYTPTRDGRCDVVADIAQRFAVPVVCAALGVPREDWHLFERWADETANPRAVHELFSYVDVMIGARCWRSSDDLLDDLIHTEVDGNELTTDELVELVTVLLTTGADLARNQLAASVAALCDHPDQWALLAAHPELAGNAVDETMRYAPVRFGQLRVAAADLELAGVRIPAGTTVHLNIAAANRDPSVYADPDRLDLTRRGPAPARSFSADTTTLELARIVVGEALAVMASRMPGLTKSGRVTWKPMVGIAGPASLPVHFEPGH